MGFNGLDLTVLGMRLHESSNHFLTFAGYPESVKRMHLETPGIEYNISIIISHLRLVHDGEDNTGGQARIGSQIASKVLTVPLTGVLWR